MPDYNPFTAWSEIDNTLDPMMSHQEHSARRTSFFYGTAAPQLKQRTPTINMQEAYAYFMQNTERQDLLGPVGHAGLQLGVAVTSLAKDLIAPATVLPHFKQLYDTIDSKQGEFKRIAERDHVSTGIAEVVGSLGGMVIPLEGLLGVAGKVSPILGRALVDGVRSQEVVSRIARGGLAFATYSAMSEQDDDKRIISGLKGAGLGAAGEVLLLPFGRSAEKALAGETRLEPPKDIDVATDLGQTGLTARQEKRPINVTATTTLKQGTANAIVKDAQGNVQPVSFRKGAEQTAHAKINEIINQGGEIVGFEHHPDQLSRVQKILTQYQDEIEPKYVESKVRVKTSSGEHAEVLGTYEQIQPPDETLREVERSRSGQSTESTPAKPPAVEITDKELEEMGLGTKESDLSAQLEARIRQVREGGGAPVSPPPKLRVQWPDSTTAQIFHIGTMRETSRMAGQLRPLTGDIYTNLNHDLGVVATRFGIPDPEGYPAGLEKGAREKVGDIAHSYYQRTVDEMRRLAPGESYTAPSVEAELRELSERLKGTPGVKPKPLRTLQQKRAAAKEPLKAADLIIPPGERASWSPGESLEEALGRAGVRVKPKEGTIASAVVTVPGDVAGPRGMTMRGEGGPVVVLTENAPKAVRRHEYIHSGMNVVGSDALIMKHIGEPHRGTALAIANALSGVKAYAGDSLISRLNEAYVHAAVGVGENQSAVLEALGRMDTDVPTVLSFVNATTRNIIDHTASQIDSMPSRILGRMLRDVERRSNPNISHTLFRAMDQIGGSAHFNTDMGLWLLKDSAGNETAVKDLHKAWDWIAAHDAGDMLPSVSFMAELGGVRGPGFPRGTEPGTGSILPDYSAMHIPGLGRNAIDNFFAPLLPSVDRLDQRVNAFMRRSGQPELPIYSTVRKAVDKSRDLQSALHNRRDDFRFLGKGVKDERWHDYFELLTKPAGEERDAMAQALNLSKEDMDVAEKLEAWKNRFETETGLPVTRYLEQDFNRLREANFSHKEAYRTTDVDKGDFFQNLAYRGRLNPQDTHFGRFAETIMKEHYIQEMKPYLEAVTDIGGQPGNDAKAEKLLGPERYRLQNWVKYMRGVPDRSAEIMNRFADDFLTAAGEKAAEMNKHLPANAQLPTDWGSGRSAIGRMTQLLAAGGVGGRPATIVRDLFAVLNTMYVVGPIRFAKGAARLLTKDGWAEADRLGFLTQGRTIAAQWGQDVVGELNPYGKMDALSRGLDRLLAPNRLAHNIARGIAGFSEYDTALDAIRRYRAGNLAALKDTSHWHALKSAQNYLERIAFDKTVPLQEAAKTFARQIVDDTQWGFSKGTQPGVLRTGYGRVFGQYGSFPAFYLEYLRHLGRKAIIEREPRGMAALGMFVTTQYAAYKAAESIGVDLSRWVGLSSAGYTGSPALEAIIAAMRAPENSTTGRQARKDLLEYASGKEFIPGQVQMHFIWKALDMPGNMFDANGVPTSKFWTALGFATTPPNPQDLDFEEWVKWEAGFGSRR